MNLHIKSMSACHSSRHIYIYVPFLLLMAFMLFYIYAASRYPGGSEFNRQASGYSWTKNFYCDLFHRTAYNGQKNAARPVAYASLVVLGAAFWSLWIVVVNCWFISGWKRGMGNAIGVFLIGSYSLMFWYHDLALKIMMFTGFLAFIFIGTLFWLTGRRAAFLLTAVFLGVSSVNFWAWALGYMQSSVPFVQKLTIACLYIWGLFLNRQVLRFHRRAEVGP